MSPQPHQLGEALATIRNALRSTAMTEGQRAQFFYDVVREVYDNVKSAAIEDTDRSYISDPPHQSHILAPIETTHAEPSRIIDQPVYRVNFWEAAPGGSSWALDAFVVNDASGVAEVLTWATQNARDRQWELMVEVGESPIVDRWTPRTNDLIRLAGVNPNEGVTVTFGGFTRTPET